MARQPRKTSKPQPPAFAYSTLSEADRLVSAANPAHAPEALREGLTAVLNAFQAYSEGRDDDARVALQSLGLQSPFLDWKLLIRGLLAFAASEHGLAIENWQRLKPEGLPHRISAVFRSRIDPAFAAQQSAENLRKLQEAANKLLNNPLIQEIRELQGSLTRNQSLKKAWLLIQPMLPELKEALPNAVPRLAGAVYAAVRLYGSPQDLPKYRAAFGAPPDDPDFYRLEAMIYEDSQDLDVAIQQWRKYDDWLATAPVGWPEPLLRRARAMILHRMGRHEVERVRSNSNDDDDDDFPFFAPPKRRTRKKKPKLHPERFFQKSLQLEPGWAQSAYSLVDWYHNTEEFEVATKAANDFLAHQPNDVPMFNRLVTLHRLQYQHAEQLDVARKILAANPLDSKNRDLFGTSLLAAARQAMMTPGRETEAETLLAEDWDTQSKTFPVSFRSLRSVVARQLGNLPEAERWEQEALEAPQRYIVACYDLAIDGLLAKLKPAQRKSTETRLTATWAMPEPHPFEVNMVIGAYMLYEAEGHKYRGQKTHLSKIVQLAERSVACPTGSELDYEMLLQRLDGMKQATIVKSLTIRLRNRFPKNPVFLLVVLKDELTHRDAYAKTHQLQKKIEELAKLIEASTEPRHKPMQQLIEQLRSELQGPMSMFDFFLK